MHSRLWAGRLCAVAILAAMLAWPGSTAASAVKFDFQTSHPVIEAGAKQTLYLKIGLVGTEPERKTARPPINVAIVLDKSGSMQTGNKIQQAREAAIQALDSLGPQDIVSIITYDSTVQVLVPATKLSNREQIVQTIRSIQPDGSTALFAGVSKGADELRKFAEKESISRLILLSDGLANVGPSAPGDLGEMGGSLRKEGISVSTIGLGLDYSEDLMTQLAARSDGNHYFVENATDLARIYEKELGRVQSVVAKGARIDIECAEGVRPVRVLGREAEISGGHVWLDLNQLYAGIERDVLLEVEVPAGAVGKELKLADASVSYFDLSAEKQEKQTASVASNYSDSKDLVRKSINTKVMVPALELIGVENNERAMKLRDEGNVEGALRVLRTNQKVLSNDATVYASPELDKAAKQNEVDSQNLDEESYKRQRKAMQQNQSWSKY